MLSVFKICRGVVRDVSLFEPQFRISNIDFVAETDRYLRERLIA